MVEWIAASGVGDPANDLCNVTLTLPTPPPSAYHQQHQQPRLSSHSASSSGRTVRPFPRRGPSQVYSNSGRIMSVNMSAPSPVYQQQPQTAGGSYFNPSSATVVPQSAPPMYNDVPMSGQSQGHVQLQSQRMQASTPLQMVSTPMPQVPGGWEYAQSQSQSQVHTPMPSMTPVLPTHSPLQELNSGMGMHIDPSVTIGAEGQEVEEEGEERRMQRSRSATGSGSGSGSDSGDSGEE